MFSATERRRSRIASPLQHPAAPVVWEERTSRKSASAAAVAATNHDLHTGRHRHQPALTMASELSALKDRVDASAVINDADFGKSSA